MGVYLGSDAWGGRLMRGRTLEHPQPPVSPTHACSVPLFAPCLSSCGLGSYVELEQSAIAQWREIAAEGGGAAIGGHTIKLLSLISTLRLYASCGYTRCATQRPLRALLRMPPASHATALLSGP